MIESEKLELWIGRKKKGDPLSELFLKMEEFRTIMGYTFNFLIIIDETTISYFAEEVLNGDDLSENLYVKPPKIEAIESSYSEIQKKETKEKGEAYQRDE